MATITGTDNADSLTGPPGEANTFFGLSGDDTLAGAAGNDTLYGERGDDLLSAGDGADLADGGDGDDDIIGGNGNDTVIAGDGDDDVNLGAGNDTVFAGDGDDAVSAFGGFVETNTIFLEAGDDYVIPGFGVDLIDGGRGQDVVHHLDSQAGVSVNLRTGRGVGGDAEGDTYRFVEDVIGSSFDDVLIGNGFSNVLEGGSGGDRIRGGIGADFLDGGADSDTLDYVGSWAGVSVSLAAGFATGGDALGDEFTGFEDVIGSDFADRLAGDAGGNRLFGGGGNDTLRGAEGADKLTGGDGADRFVFLSTADSTAAAAGRDAVLDFSLSGGDVLDLSGIDADTAAGGNQAFSFIGAGVFTGASGQVRYQASGGTTQVFGDVDGDRVADFAVALVGPLALTAGDFAL